MVNVEFDLDATIRQQLIARQVEVKNLDLVKLCISGIIDPPDGKRWPPSWRKAGKRLVTILEDLDEEYWKVFEVIGSAPVAEMNEWNTLVRLPIGKRMRRLGRPLRLVAVIEGGRYFWDFLILCNMKDKKTMSAAIVESTKGTQVDFLVPKWVWKFLRNRKMWDAPVREEKQDFGIQVVEDGE